MNSFSNILGMVNQFVNSYQMANKVSQTSTVNHSNYNYGNYYPSYPNIAGQNSLRGMYQHYYGKMKTFLYKSL